MKTSRALSKLTKLAKAFISCALISSCVELTGQRITIHYDEPRDELLILIQHDGIHDSGSDKSGDGRKQIPEYVRNGNVLFLDWPGYVQKEEFRRDAASESQPPELRAFYDAIATTVKSIPLGHYRDPKGRIGAAQLVQVSHAKDFIRKANAALNEGILGSQGDGPWHFTAERMRAGAKEGRQWLSLEGHSIRFSFLSHPGEWATNKAKFVRVLMDGYGEAVEKQLAMAEDRYQPEYLVQLLSLSPLSLTESQEEVVLRLGNPKQSSTYRFFLRSQYSKTLEETVVTEVPVNLDHELAERLLKGEKAALEPSLAAVLSWGPPEEAVRALLDAASSREEAAWKPALDRLKAWGEAWSRSQGLPEAPSFIDDKTAYLEAWKDWYGRMLAFPFEGPTPTSFR